jgi:hypothetical protein
MLEEQGYDCYVTSPASFNSNWDRACNVYAELTGSVVDYGEAHAREYGHARYGYDYGQPLLEGWGPERPVNLLGHSLGGQTVYLLAHLLAEGSAQERETTRDGSLSPLFAGGQSDLVHSVTTLGGLLNGSSAEPFFLGDWFYYALLPTFAVGFPSVFQYTGLSDAMRYVESGDHALYDLSPPGAAAMNLKTRTQEDIYYFSYTLCDTVLDEETGEEVMNTENILHAGITGPVPYLLGLSMGNGYSRFEGMTFECPGGSFTVDDTWRANDGVASVAASKYPFGSPHKEFDEGSIERGVWQSFPTMQGYNHGFFGGFDFKHSFGELYDFYLRHMRILDLTY